MKLIHFVPTQVFKGLQVPLHSKVNLFPPLVDIQKISCELIEGKIGLYNIFTKKLDFGGIFPDKSDIKKIEVKTTTRPERIHHFLHQQLDIDRLDIRIISILLQKDDKGMSLKELIHKCKEIFKTNPIIIIYIESMIKNIDENELNAIAFNEYYSQDNFKIYNGIDIPRLQEKNVDGVYNIEYDVDFSNVKEMQVSDFKNWSIE